LEAEMLFGRDILQHLPFLVAAFIPALTFHEWGHAAMAKYQGDDTAEQEGRLTLNPLAHLDWLGTMAIVLIGFGWAKPVPVNPNRLKGRWGEFWVASAGPLMNLVLAIGFAILIHLNIASLLPQPYDAYAGRVFELSIFLNLALMFFNLIPVGPLDGRTVLSRLLPLRQSISFDLWNAKFGSFVLLGLIATEFIFHFGLLRILIGVPTSFVTNLLL
jgi:Zn-dependent protease